MAPCERTRDRRLEVRVGELGGLLGHRHAGERREERHRDHGLHRREEGGGRRGNTGKSGSVGGWKPHSGRFLRGARGSLGMEDEYFLLSGAQEDQAKVWVLAPGEIRASDRPVFRAKASAVVCGAWNHSCASVAACAEGSGSEGA